MNPVYLIIAVRTAQASLLAMLAHWLLHWPLTGPHAVGFFLTPALCLYFVFVFTGPLTWGLPILSRLPHPRNTAALTFDDGPSAVTPLILDILRADSITATFFVLGEAVTRHPEVLRRIASEGHAIGIHAYTHEPFVLKNTRAIREEITKTEDAIHRACPDAEIVPWVRPPHGFKSLSLIGTLRQAGYGLAAWSVNSRDYLEDDPQQIASQIAGKLKAGSILLLHDGPKNRATADALSLMLQSLTERGLVPVSLKNGVSSR